MKMCTKRLISVLLALITILSICPLAYAEQETLACGHASYNPTISAKEPTCENYGYTEQRECKECTFVQKAEYIPATGHHYEINKSKLTADGALYVCKDCGDYYVKPHSNWTDIIIGKKPTCTEGGYTGERTCPDCGYHEKNEYLDPIAHSFKTLAVDEQKHTVECKNCSYKATDESHDIIFVYDNDYGCYSENATGKRICSICNFVLEDGIKVSSKEHHKNITIEDKGAYEHHICQDCGHISVVAKNIVCTNCSNKIDAENFVIKQATCEKSGYLSYTCSSCKKQETVPLSAYGHHLTDELAVIQEPTCQQNGIKGKLCYRCDYIEQVDLGKIGHKYVLLEEGVEVGCETDGLTGVGYCVYCSDIINNVVIPATGHTLIDYFNVPFCVKCNKYLVDTNEGTVACKCLCHNGDGLSKKIYQLILFFAKLFGFMQGCDCGAVHYVK